jgi:hypothetical protein
MAEKFGDEAGVASRLSEPGRGGVTECVRGDVLVELSAFGGPRDDARQDRLLQTPSSESAEHWVVRRRPPLSA